MTLSKLPTEYDISPLCRKEYEKAKADARRWLKRPDIEGRLPKNVIREIANDLLSGKRIRVEFRTGNCYPIHTLEICSKDDDGLSPYRVHLDYYELAADELFCRETLVRSGKKIYWRGYEKKLTN